MGSQSFLNVGTHIDPERAFWSEVKKALDVYGRDGYTGTIAEKYEFEVFIPPAARGSRRFVRDLEAETFSGRIDSLTYVGDENFADALRTYRDKWGPAVAIPGDRIGEWIFCGLASS